MFRDRREWREIVLEAKLHHFRLRRSRRKREEGRGGGEEELV
jgi:hypothetical protein